MRKSFFFSSTVACLIFNIIHVHQKLFGFFCKEAIGFHEFFFVKHFCFIYLTTLLPQKKTFCKLFFIKNFNTFFKVYCKYKKKFNSSFFNLSYFQFFLIVNICFSIIISMTSTTIKTVIIKVYSVQLQYSLGSS